MLTCDLKITVNFEGETLDTFKRLADGIERLTQIVSASRFSYQLNLGELKMPIYPSDKPDFDAVLTIDGLDSEGFPVKNIPVPANHVLTVTSDNAAAFSIVQDAADARILHCHVGGPNADGTPAQSNVLANLVDPVGNLVATGGGLVTVQAGAVVTISGINLNLPEN